MNRLVLRVLNSYLLYTILILSVLLYFIDSELPVDKNTPLDIQDKETKKTTTEATEEITEGEFFYSSIKFVLIIVPQSLQLKCLHRICQN